MLEARSRWSSMWRLAFAITAIAWALALPLAAWAAARPAPSLTLSAFVVAAYGLGSVVCHQLPTRSFHLWARQLPVCARCMGIYGGGALAAIASIISRARLVRTTAGPTHPAHQTHPAHLTCLAAALPTVVTLAYEWTGGGTPADWVRALAGAPLGALVAWLVVRGDEVN
jgi:hypothetical protein